MGMPEIDELDYRLVKILSTDGRIRTKRIASMLGVSEPTVRSRLKRLRESGLLNVRASLDLRRLDCTAAFITLKLKASRIQEAIKTISQMPEVDALYQTLGEYDLILLATAKDSRGVQRLNEKIAGIDGVEALRTSLLIDVVAAKSGLSVRPGVGVRARCQNCGKVVAEGTEILDCDLFFCSQTCVAEYRSKHPI